MNPDTEMIDDALARIVPFGEELVDHIDSKFIRTGGCANYAHVKHESFKANFWTVESCAAKASSYSWAKNFFINDSKIYCYVYAAGCTADGGPYRYYELKNKDDSIAFRQPKFTWNGGCANWRDIKYHKDIPGSNWTVAECSDLCKNTSWCKTFFLPTDKKYCIPYAAGCTQGGGAYKYYTYPDSYSESIATGKAEFMWHGGCINRGGAKHVSLNGKNWNADTCLAKTKSYTWATGFFINTAKTACLPFGDGCT